MDLDCKQRRRCGLISGDSEMTLTRVRDNRIGEQWPCLDSEPVLR
jgi:hypothetical protein